MILKRVLVGAGGLALVGLIALLALFGGAGVANAQTDPTATPTTPQTTATPKPAPAIGDVVSYSGTITNVASSGFTLETRGGTLVEVTTSSSTTWFVIDNNGTRAEGSLADLAVGDTVTVAGTLSGTDAVAARLVTEGGAGFGGRGGRGDGPGGRHGGSGGRIGQLQATVTEINGSTLTVTGPNGNASFTITTDANTLFVKGGFTNLSSIAVGDQVYVVPRAGSRTEPTTGSAATWTAAAIVSVADGDAVRLGRVESVSGNTVTLRAGRGGTATTVNVGASTGYKQYSSDTQTFSDSSLSAVVAGSNVLIYGTTAADGSISASAVVLLPENVRGSRSGDGFPGLDGQILPGNGTRQRGPVIGSGSDI